jgi:hypothetical protein
VSHATRSPTTALICMALGIPALAHAKPPVHWQIRTDPPPISLRIALGPADDPCLKCRADRSGVRRSELADLRPTVTGWTQPLGLRIVLRW